MRRRLIALPVEHGGFIAAWQPQPPLCRQPAQQLLECQRIDRQFVAVDNVDGVDRPYG